MSNVPQEPGDESNTAASLELENLAGLVGSFEVESATSNTVVTVTATLSSDNSFITVDWHPHVIYSTLVRVDQTTGDVQTRLAKYASEYPAFGDHWKLVKGNSYVYELFVPGNLHSPFRSAPVIPRTIGFIPNPHLSLSHEIGDVDNTAASLELENVEARVVSPKVESAASNTVVTVTATLSNDNSFIIVDWHPHVIYSSLTRVNQTTGAIDTLLNKYDPEFPTYDDSNINNGNNYVYELFVPDNPGSPFRSGPITQVQMMSR